MTQPLPVDLQEGEQREVEARALEIGELVGRGDDRLGIGRAAELEFEQRHAADRALLDHPGHGAVLAFLDQDARDIGRDAEADIDGVAVAQFLRDAAGDHLGDVEGRGLEARQRAAHLAGDGGVVDGLRRLHLVGRDHDGIDEDARHEDVLRA